MNRAEIAINMNNPANYLVSLWLYRLKIFFFLNLFFSHLLRIHHALTHWVSLVVTWWALQMRSRSWRFRNLLTTSAPKVKETPRSFSPQPCTSLSGSDHSRSHNRPERRAWVLLNMLLAQCFSIHLKLSCYSIMAKKVMFPMVTLVRCRGGGTHHYLRSSVLTNGEQGLQHHVWADRVPVSGTSVGLMILRICSIDCKSGESPERNPINCDRLAKVLSTYLDFKSDIMGTSPRSQQISYLRGSRRSSHQWWQQSEGS